MDDNSSDDNCEIDKDASPPRPKRPKIGAVRYGTKFNIDWKVDYPFIEPGKFDPEHSFYCKVCDNATIRVLPISRDTRRQLLIARKFEM